MPQEALPKPPECPRNDDLSSPRVWNRRLGGIPPGAVYVGRPSPFGNPFPLQTDSNRAEVVEEYEVWLLSHPSLVARVKRELKGKDLVCWCSPLECHADVLLRVANE